MNPSEELFAFREILGSLAPGVLVLSVWRLLFVEGPMLMPKSWIVEDSSWIGGVIVGVVTYAVGLCIRMLAETGQRFHGELLMLSRLSGKRPLFVMTGWVFSLPDKSRAPSELEHVAWSIRLIDVVHFYLGERAFVRLSGSDFSRVLWAAILPSTASAAGLIHESESIQRKRMFLQGLAFSLILCAGLFLTKSILSCCLDLTGSGLGIGDLNKSAGSVRQIFLAVVCVVGSFVLRSVCGELSAEEEVILIAVVNQASKHSSTAATPAS